MKISLFIVLLQLLVVPVTLLAGQGMGPGPGIYFVAGPPVLIPNPSFESPILTANSNTNTDNWAPNTYGYAGGMGIMVAERLANATMTGSYVGHLKAQSDNYDDGEVITLSQANASLSVSIPKATLDANSVITIDIKPLAIGDSQCRAALAITGMNAAGTVYYNAGSLKHFTKLFGYADAGNTTTYAYSPTVGVTHDIIIDLKQYVIDTLDAGKAWSDVELVRFTISLDSKSTAFSAVEVLVDNVRW